MRNGSGAAKVKVLKPEDSARISNFITNLTNSGGTKLGNLQRTNLSRDTKKSSYKRALLNYVMPFIRGFSNNGAFILFPT